MIEGKWFAQGEDLSQPLAVREAVLGRGRDSLDGGARQVVVYGEGIPVGTARLWWADGDFHMGDVCVLPGERHKGYGDLLVRLVLYKAISHQARRVSLVCPAALVSFFTRYGFAVTAGTDPVEMIAETSAGCLGCGHSGGQG